jgi:hypothetical protein
MGGEQPRGCRNTNKWKHFACGSFAVIYLRPELCRTFVTVRSLGLIERAVSLLDLLLSDAAPVKSDSLIASGVGLMSVSSEARST